jgi:hypothetical protein
MIKWQRMKIGRVGGKTPVRDWARPVWNPNDTPIEDLIVLMRSRYSAYARIIGKDRHGNVIRATGPHALIFNACDLAERDFGTVGDEKAQEARLDLAKVTALTHGDPTITADYNRLTVAVLRREDGAEETLRHWLLDLAEAENLPMPQSNFAAVRGVNETELVPENFVPGLS